MPNTTADRGGGGSGGGGDGSWQNEVEAVVAERLVSLVGSQGAPVVGIRFENLTLQYSRPTFLGGPTSKRFQANALGRSMLLNV